MKFPKTPTSIDYKICPKTVLQRKKRRTMMGKRENGVYIIRKKKENRDCTIIMTKNDNDNES